MKIHFAAAVALFTLAACAREAGNTPTPDAIEAAAARQEVESVLDRYYQAVGAADYDGFIALFDDDSLFFGTDATEKWTRAEFGPAIEDSFSGGKGWDFELKDRIVAVAEDGQTAWFAELAHYKNTDYLLRPSGVMRLRNGAWKIVQIVMGIPIPNDLYGPTLQGLQARDLGDAYESGRIETVLNSLHRAAADADSETYFDLFTADAVFLGTDASERWTLEQFKAYAAPHFDKGQGWRYTPVERHIVLSPMKNAAFFDERLDSESYGAARGTGALVRTSKGWKIAQYNLTFPVPNALADEITARIRAHEAGE